MTRRDRRPAALLAAVVVVLALGAGPLAGALPTGAQTAGNAATPTPTPTLTPTPTPEPNDGNTTDGATNETETNGSTTDEGARIDPDVVVEQWDDRIQIVVLLDEVPDSVASFEVRGAAMESDLRPADSPPAGEGTVDKPTTVEVVVVYEDGSEAVIHEETVE